MKKFLIQIILFIAIFAFVFLYFGDSGSFRITAFDYDIETTVSIAVASMLFFVIIVSYLSFLFRFIISLPWRIATFYTGLKTKKARQLLFRMVSLKEGGVEDAAISIFKKYGKQLVDKNYDIAKLLDYKMHKDQLNKANLLQKYIQLSSCVGGGEIITHDFLLPQFKTGNIEEIERFSQEIINNKKCANSHLMTQVFLMLGHNNFESSSKSLDKLPDDYISRKTYLYISTYILCKKAALLIEQKSFAKAEKTLLQALSMKPGLIKIVQIAKKLPKKHLATNKYNSIIETTWSKSPCNELVAVYLLVNDDGVSSKTLDLLDTLLNLNDTKAAKLIIGTEYLIHGYKKESESLLNQVDEITRDNCCYLRRAIIFRDALATEKKSEKLEKFRKLIFINYDS